MFLVRMYVQVPRGTQEQALLSHLLWPLSAGGGCCGALGGHNSRWHLLWEHIVPVASGDQQLGFSALPDSWLMVLGPDPPQSRRAARTEGERDETIHTSMWWSGVEFFTWILAVHFIAVSSTFCWISMTQTRSFDSPVCFSHDK